MLNPSQFGTLFHGTRASLDVGDRVLPSRVSGAETGLMTSFDTPENASGKYAFAIHGSGDHAHTDDDAEHYAWSMANRNHIGTDRPRVLTVAPSHDMEPGDYHWDSPTNEDRRQVTESFKSDNHIPEYRSPTGFRVTGVHDTMPGRQGTLPINWAQFHSNRNTVEANHPGDGISDERLRDWEEYKGKDMAHDHTNAIRRSMGEGQKTLF